MRAPNRKPQTIERDARIWELHKNGIQNQRIAEREGISGPAVTQALRRAVQQIFTFEDAEQQLVEKSRLEDLIARLQYELRTPAYAYAAGSGRVITNPDTGQPLIDRGYTLAVLRELRATYESMRKLLGTDAITTTRRIIEVVSEETIEQKIADLELELANNDDRKPAASPKAIGGS